MSQSVVLQIFAFIISTTTFAQKTNNVWYFGKHAGLDFNANPAVSIMKVCPGTILVLEQVFVFDTLPDQLDPSSFRFIGSSHDVEVSVLENHILKFLFENINLPHSSTDQLGSRGMVVFEMSPQPEMRRGQMIRNDASIYFDFHQPEVTNEKQHRMIGTEQSDSTLYEIFLHPNPTRDMISLQTEKAEQLTIEILTIDGRTLWTERPPVSFMYPIDTGHLPSGMYLCKVSMAYGEKILKFIKE